MDSRGEEHCSERRRSQKRDHSGHSRGRSLHRGSQERKRSRRSRSPSPPQRKRSKSQSASDSFDAWLKNEDLSHKLGEEFYCVREHDDTTAWLEDDEEAMEMLKAGKLMAQELSHKECKLKASQKVVMMLQMQASEDDLGCEDDDDLGCKDLGKKYILQLCKCNAKRSAEIRQLKDAIEAVKLMLQCKRYKQLYEKIHQRLCIHKQHRDDHQGRCPYGTCNKTGETLWAKDVAYCNRENPHEIDGAKCTVADTSTLQTYSHGPEPSFTPILTWKHIDQDAANQSMDTEVKEALAVTYKALDLSTDKSTTE